MKNKLITLFVLINLCLISCKEKSTVISQTFNLRLDSIKMTYIKFDITKILYDSKPSIKIYFSSNKDLKDSAIFEVYCIRIIDQELNKTFLKDSIIKTRNGFVKYELSVDFDKNLGSGYYEKLQYLYHKIGTSQVCFYKRELSEDKFKLLFCNSIGEKYMKCDTIIRNPAFRISNSNP